MAAMLNSRHIEKIVIYTLIKEGPPLHSLHIRKENLFDSTEDLNLIDLAGKIDLFEDQMRQKVKDEH